ncbi:hypothetical protein M422DRAFT_51037 [Sphaerobolus stellatus SS14]|uniref:Uncharacterized protein n=1 Tax=Sphaerobolus stellatus (strain SS14) TaxID=990650 RepID=A0A0C9USK7_SPHS4|nr:hypothetical protein M422DRAFT_54696 [Sphaerobolus stellatus SS14]KIJ36564.1 hypothetical protein M422DRAFT_51037 [Sphaerobolus stellatus SS14]
MEERHGRLLNAAKSVTRSQSPKTEVSIGLFVNKYQSSEESQYEEVKSGDESQAARVVQTDKPFILHAPLYRAPFLQELYEKLDVVRRKAWREKEDSKVKGAKYQDWIIGDRVERPLPKVSKNASRIRKEHLDEEWTTKQDEGIILTRTYQADLAAAEQVNDGDDEGDMEDDGAAGE